MPTASACSRVDVGRASTAPWGEVSRRISPFRMSRRARSRADLDPVVPGDLGHRVRVLEQPRLVRPPAVMQHAVRIDEQHELALALEGWLGVAQLRRARRERHLAAAPAPRRRDRPAAGPSARTRRRRPPRSPARLSQRLRRWASHDGAVNLASAPPAFLATRRRMSPAARVSNTGSITGCIRLRTPVRGARSSHRSSAWLCGSRRSHWAAVSSRKSEVETLNPTFLSLSAKPEALGSAYTGLASCTREARPARRRSP